MSIFGNREKFPHLHQLFTNVYYKFDIVRKRCYNILQNKKYHLDSQERKQLKKLLQYILKFLDNDDNVVFTGKLIFHWFEGNCVKVTKEDTEKL